MSYLVVQLKSPIDIHPLEKKKYINSLYEDYHSRRAQKAEGRALGFYTKFAHALGFKPYRGKKHEETYFVTPDEIISRHMYAYPNGDIICDFYVEKGETIAPNGAYSFNNEEIANKWANFLKKVFPHLEVSMFEKENKPNREVWLTSFIFSSIEEYPVCIETSLQTKPTNAEKLAILEIINLYIDQPLKFKLIAFRCKTCAGYNPNTPIHLELDYHYNDASNKESAEKYGYEYKGPRCFNCSEVLTNQADDMCEDCRARLKGKIILEVN